MIRFKNFDLDDPSVRDVVAEFAVEHLDDVIEDKEYSLSFLKSHPGTASLFYSPFVSLGS